MVVVAFIALNTTMAKVRGDYIPSSVPRKSIEDHRLILENLRLPLLEDGPSSTSSYIVSGEGSAADEDMKTLLVHRAVLFAALFTLTGDTRCI